VNFAEYRALPGVNWSSLKLVEQSAKHYRHAVDNPNHVETDAMRLGTAVHTALLEPEAWADSIAVYGGTRRGKVWQEFQDANPGKAILKADAMAKVLAMQAAVHADPVARRYLNGAGSNERTIQWTDEATGIVCKGRADRVADNVCGDRVLVDVKTTRDASPRAFGQSAGRLGYHAQLAFYADGLAARGEPVDKVVILAVESAPPFDCGILILDDATLELGQYTYRALLERVRDCREAGDWPGRYVQESSLQLPAWMWAHDDDEDASAGLVGLEG